jgi:hypothetical protein
MVPLRVTMESFGACVGYDPDKSTAIIITEQGRIEVPINTNTIYYNYDWKVENDTNAVVSNGRIYLPIRAVLECAGFSHIEWDSNTKTVVAYSFEVDDSELFVDSIPDLAMLTQNLLLGSVIFVNGQYYSTPDYIKRLENIVIHYYEDDLNIAIFTTFTTEIQANTDGVWETEYNWNTTRNTEYNLTARDVEMAKRAALADLYEKLAMDDTDQYWISFRRFGKVLAGDAEIEKFGITGEQVGLPGWSLVYAFYEHGMPGGSASGLLYCVDDMDDGFMNADNAIGKFSGINMKKENGVLYFWYPDLKERGIYN